MDIFIDKVKEIVQNKDFYQAASLLSSEFPEIDKIITSEASIGQIFPIIIHFGKPYDCYLIAKNITGRIEVDKLKVMNIKECER